MSKIVQALNAMLANPDNITKVMRGENEYFFLYRDKHKWSIARDDTDGSHRVWFYPGEEKLEKLATLPPEEFFGLDFVLYHDKEIGTKEARATFAELYLLVRERVFGVNKVLDEIIGDM